MVSTGSFFLQTGTEQTEEMEQKRPFYLNVNIRCLRQRAMIPIIVAKLKKKEVIPDAE